MKVLLEDLIKNRLNTHSSELAQHLMQIPLIAAAQDLLFAAKIAEASLVVKKRVSEIELESTRRLLRDAITKAESKRHIRK